MTTIISSSTVPSGAAPRPAVGDAQAVIDVARLSVAAEPLDEGTIYLVTAADGSQRIVDTMGYAGQPARVKRKPVVWTAESFARYLRCQDYEDAPPPPLEIWADVDKARMIGIVDGGRGWRDHRVTLQLHHTPEWQAWTKWNGELLTQVTFAEFLEERLVDIVRPEAAVMLELAQSFQAKSRVSFESSRWLADGRRALEYKETIEARAGEKGAIEIPATFELGLAPFVGGDVYRVTARFRYRIKDNCLLLGWKLVQPDDVVKAAFGDVVAKVADLLDTTADAVLAGDPGQ